MRTFSWTRSFCGAVAVLSMLVGFATGCDDDDSGEIATVDVVYVDESVTIDLGELEAVAVADEEGYVRMSDIVDAAAIGVAIEDLEFDFEGGDGFLASSSPNCVDHIPVAGALLEQGYIHRVTRNLAWDDALGMPGCTRVDNTARIHASNVGTGSEIEVVYGETSSFIGMGSLNIVEFEGEDHAQLEEVITSASLGVLTSGLGFDFESGAGVRPSSSEDCASLTPISADQIEHAFINVATRDLSWAAEAGLPDCMNVNDLVLIEATDL